MHISGVERARSTVHNWDHKADLQPETDRTPHHIAVNETVIQLDNQRYWPYAAVDPETNELPHRKFKPTRTNVLVYAFFERREKHAVDDAVFLLNWPHR